MVFIKKHFHTLDALRFLAFLKVFLFHLPITVFPFFNLLRGEGGIGVTFFFVLSGFLITYIILEEKSITGRLNLYHFFVRRILRIWPLYFLMVGFAWSTPYLLSFFHLGYSDKGYTPDWIMTLSFLENYKMIIMNDFPNVSPLGVMWSLCIEEHFYILWGIIFSLFQVKDIPKVLIICIILSFFSNILFFKLNLLSIEILTNLIYFAIGAFPAWWLMYKKTQFENVVNIISSKIAKMYVLILIIIVIISGKIEYTWKPVFQPLVHSVLFAGLLCLIVTDNYKLKLSDNSIFSKLGLYTYGLYLVHTIVINLFLKIFDQLKLSLFEVIPAIVFIIITLSVTIVISMILYWMYEKPFLRLKYYFY